MEQYETMKVENRDAVARFRDNGLDLSKKREFEFCAVLPNKEACLLARNNFVTSFDIPESGVFMISEYHDEIILKLCVEMLPNVEKITELEFNLNMASKEIENTEVYWEFKE